MFLVKQLRSSKITPIILRDNSLLSVSVSWLVTLIFAFFRNKTTRTGHRHWGRWLVLLVLLYFWSSRVDALQQTCVLTGVK